MSATATSSASRSAALQLVQGKIADTAKDGTSKLLKHCTLPPAGSGVVDMVITELAVFTLRRGVPTGLTLIQLADGVTADEVKAKTNADYTIGLM